VDEILGIITMINSIASQTSILAMNAAIEAAHAGEYGRGFAVVAEEIRKLSESTNENSKRIRDQLDRVAELVGETHSMSAKTKESFASVQAEVESTAQAFDEISSTMRELSAGTESVMNSSVQVGDVTTTIQREVTGVAAQSGEITRTQSAPE
jgi:methyl-accepting chemotaxis protein